MKTPIDQTDLEVAKPWFYADRRTAAQHLEKLLGEKRFPFPKDHTVLMRWFNLTAPKNAVIVDFFGGSGSTLEAVLRLNEQDGGTRQCIVVTSNELGEKEERVQAKAGHGPGDPEWEAKGVFEYVLRPRIETILTSLRPDGSTYDKALAGQHRVEFFTLDYMDDPDTFIDYDLMAPLLWARSDGVGAIPPKPKPGASVVGERFAILFDPDQASKLVEQLAHRPLVKTVFIVEGIEAVYEQTASDIVTRLAQPVRTVHLEKTYLASRTWTPRDRRRRAS